MTRGKNAYVTMVTTLQIPIISKVKRRQTSLFQVTFYWLIGKFSLSSFIPALNF